MNFLKKLFGYRTTRAPSGSLRASDLLGIAINLTLYAGQKNAAQIIPYTVTNTNSMLPTFDSNAILLAERVPFEALAEGDIVTYYRKSGLRVVHRLNEKLKDGWWPLGDGNGTMDPELVTPANFDRRICGILYGSKTSDTNN